MSSQSSGGGGTAAWASTGTHRSQKARGTSQSPGSGSPGPGAAEPPPLVSPGIRGLTRGRLAPGASAPLLSRPHWTAELCEAAPAQATSC